MSTNQKNSLRSIMSLAWEFVKKFGFTMSEALRRAWMNAKLSKKMNDRVVKFRFLKKDGTIRTAYGTLDSTYMPTNCIKGTGKSSPKTQVYFDKEVNGFRCFLKQNLLWVE